MHTPDWRHRWSRAVAALALTSALTGALSDPLVAQTPHYRLTVPVTLSNLHPDVLAAALSCGLKNANHPTSYVVLGTRQEVPLTLVNGAFSGSITLSFVLPTSVSQTDVRGYFCNLRLQKRGTGQWMDAVGSYANQPGATPGDWYRDARGPNYTPGAGDPQRFPFHGIVP